VAVERFDPDPELAVALAKAAIGWYSRSLSEQETVDRIESLLREHGHDDWLVPGWVWSSDRE
jgi:hypothetical protein